MCIQSWDCSLGSHRTSIICTAALVHFQGGSSLTGRYESLVGTWVPVQGFQGRGLVTRDWTGPSVLARLALGGRETPIPKFCLDFWHLSKVSLQLIAFSVCQIDIVEMLDLKVDKQSFDICVYTWDNSSGSHRTGCMCHFFCAPPPGQKMRLRQFSVKNHFFQNFTPFFVERSIR